MDMNWLQRVKKDSFRGMIKTLDPWFALTGQKYLNQTALYFVVYYHNLKFATLYLLNGEPKRILPDQQPFYYPNTRRIKRCNIQ